MVQVELMLNGSFEIYFVPGIPGLDWVTNNILALQYVLDELKDRKSCLDDLQIISARNPEFNQSWNTDVEHRL